MPIKTRIKARDLQYKTDMFCDHEFFLDGEWHEVIQADIYRMPNSPLSLITAGIQSFDVPMDDRIEFRKKVK